MKFLTALLLVLAFSVSPAFANGGTNVQVQVQTRPFFRPFFFRPFVRRQVVNVQVAPSHGFNRTQRVFVDQFGNVHVVN